MSLWAWSVAAYARPGVADACLALQDDHGQCVCLLLWAAWAGPVDAATLDRAAHIARQWEARALAPLRTARRGMKAPADGLADAPRQRLREDVKAAELRAERMLLEALEGLAAPSGTPETHPLDAAVRAWGKPASAEALAALAAALG